MPADRDKPAARDECAAYDAASPRRVAGPAVLVIASRFAPQTGPGATRLVKTVRYLRELGWRPAVLTRELCGANEIAAQASAELPVDVPIMRLRAASAEDGLARIEPLIRTAAKLTRPLGRSASWWYTGLRWRAEQWRERLAFPDVGIWRVGEAVREARRLHAQHNFRAILSSGMPFSDHMLALAIQRTLRRPWVAEFRDPWFEYAHAPQWCTALGREATRRAERTVVARARFVVSVSPEMTRRFRERYPAERSSKFVTVLNGYDPADFAEPRATLPCPPFADAEQAARQFIILHAGSFYAARRPQPLLRAFRRFIAADASRRGHAALVLAGSLGAHAAAATQLSRGLPVHCVGTLDYRATLACMTRAAVNVLVLPGGAGTEGDVSTKVFEYLGSGRPILAAAPADGAAAQLLADFDGVWRVEPDDENGLLRALEALHGLWRAGTLQPRRDPAALDRLTRRHQTQRLAQVLTMAACGPGEGRRTAHAFSTDHVEPGMSALEPVCR